MSSDRPFSHKSQFLKHSRERKVIMWLDDIGGVPVKSLEWGL